MSNPACNFTEQQLLHKIQSYGLQPQGAFKAQIRHSELQRIVNDTRVLENNSLSAVVKQLESWSKSRDIQSFTSQINQLSSVWQDALRNGVNVTQLLSFVPCFQITSLFTQDASRKFQCLLMDTLAESAQHQHQATLEHMQRFDENTQLPNTLQVLSDLDSVVDLAPQNQMICLCAIHFQIAKNSSVFSQVLTMRLSKKIAEILKQNISSDLLLYYGDNLQFDLLIPTYKNEVQLNLLAAKLDRAFEEMIFVGNQSVLVTPFIGCATIIKSDFMEYDVYTRAKLALDCAIQRQQRFVIFTQDLEKQLTEQNELELKVLDAFATDSLTLFFQPIVNIKNTRCVGAELLLRWSEKAGYSVYPNVTVEILNKVGKGKLFTRWLVNSACRYAAELTQQHKLDVYLTLNLRAEDLYDIELPHLLLQALALWKLKPANIVLEITEDGVLEHNETTGAVIKHLTESGFKLALDDFGTGFSSLSRLRTLPITLIKIDQSFVRNINHSMEDYKIVKSIAVLANSLGKEVLAEGVEDEDCLAKIKKMGIHKCQGYFYAKPMPLEQFITWAKAHP